MILEEAEVFQVYLNLNRPNLLQFCSPMSRFDFSRFFFESWKLKVVVCCANDQLVSAKID